MLAYLINNRLFNLSLLDNKTKPVTKSCLIIKPSLLLNPSVEILLDISPSFILVFYQLNFFFHDFLISATVSGGLLWKLFITCPICKPGFRSLFSEIKKQGKAPTMVSIWFLKLIVTSVHFRNFDSFTIYSVGCSNTYKKWLSYAPIRDSAALHGTPQCCRVTILTLDLNLSILRVIMPNFSSIR